MDKILFFCGWLVFSVACIIVVWYLAAHSEKKMWNGGYCPKCGERLFLFRMDNRGGHEWVCRHCGYKTLVYYHKEVYKMKKEGHNTK